MENHINLHDLSMNLSTIQAALATDLPHSTNTWESWMNSPELACTSFLRTSSNDNWDTLSKKWERLSRQKSLHELVTFPKNIEKRLASDVKATTQDVMIGWALSRGMAPQGEDWEQPRWIQRFINAGCHAKTTYDQHRLLSSMVAHASSWNMTFLEHVLDSRFDQEVKSTGMGPALSIAVKASVYNEPLLNLLIRKGADFETPDDDGRLPLHNAAIQPTAHALNFLLKQGANVRALRLENEYEQDPKDWDSYPRDPSHDAPTYGTNTLHNAAMHAPTFATVQALLDIGMPINEPDATGQTALHWAVEQRNVVAIEGLIMAGADVNARNRHGQTPIERLVVDIDSFDIEIVMSADLDRRIATAEARDTTIQESFLHWIRQARLAEEEALRHIALEGVSRNVEKIRSRL